MKIAFATDIHLDSLRGETPEDAGRRLAEESASAEILLLGGDISQGNVLFEHLSAFATGYAKPIFFVLGNHDYWMAGARKAHHTAEKLGRRVPNLTWLRTSPVVEFSKTTALLGHDGFYDAGWGDGRNSSVRLNDWRANPDFVGLHRYALVEKLQEMGRRHAREAGEKIEASIATYSRIIFVTHVPPWPQATWHDGRASDHEHLPWYTARYMGEMLERVAAAHPAREFLVSCGHTHGQGVAYILPNLTVFTGGALYGHPAIARTLDIGHPSLFASLIASIVGGM